MKNKHYLVPVFGSLVIIALALGSGFNAAAADPHLTMKGAQHLKHLGSVEEGETLKRGDTLAMVCAKCKSVSIVRVERQRGREFLKPGTQHGCSGCGSVIEVTGQRIDKKVNVKHVCKSCGDDSAFCCATRKSEPTSGMEKK